MFKILLLISELRLLGLINMCYLGTKGETDTGAWLERVWEGNFVLSDAEGNILRPLQSSNGRYISVTNIISNSSKVGKAMILGSYRLFYFISMNKLGTKRNTGKGIPSLLEAALGNKFALSHAKTNTFKSFNKVGRAYLLLVKILLVIHLKSQQLRLLEVNDSCFINMGNQREKQVKRYLGHQDETYRSSFQ